MDNYYSIGQMGRLLGIGNAIDHMIDVGRIKRPTHKVKGKSKLYYDVHDFVLIHNELSKDDNYMTITDMAHECGISNVNMFVWIKDGTVPGPKHKRGTKRFYRHDEIDTIKQAIANREYRQPRNPYEGYYTVKRMAKELDMPKVSFEYWLREKGLPRPHKRIVGTRNLVYEKCDIAKLKAYLAKHNYRRLPAMGAHLVK